MSAVNGYYANPRYVAAAVLKSRDSVARRSDPLFVRLMSSLALAQPDDVLGYTLDFLKSGGGSAPSGRPATAAAALGGGGGGGGGGRVRPPPIPGVFSSEATREYFEGIADPVLQRLQRAVATDAPFNVSEYLVRRIEAGDFDFGSAEGGEGIPKSVMNAVRISGILVEVHVKATPTSLDITAFDPLTRKSAALTMSRDDVRWSAMAAFRGNVIRHLPNLCRLAVDAAGLLHLSWKRPASAGTRRGMRWGAHYVDVSLAHRGDGIDLGVFDIRTRKDVHVFVPNRDSNYQALTATNDVLASLPDAADLSEDADGKLCFAWREKSVLVAPGGLPPAIANGVRWGGRLVEVSMVQRASDSVDINVYDPATRASSKTILAHTDPSYRALVAHGAGDALKALPDLADLVTAPGGDLSIVWHARPVSELGARVAPKADKSAGVSISGLFLQAELRYLAGETVQVVLWDARSRTTATSHISTRDEDYKAMVNEAGEVVLSRLAEVATVKRDADSGGLVLLWNSERDAAPQPEPPKNGMVIDGSYYIVMLRPHGRLDVAVELYDPVSSSSASIVVPRTHPAVAATLATSPLVLRALRPHLRASVEDGRLQLAWVA